MQLSYPEPECVLQVCESTPDNGMEKGCKSLAICTLSLPAERGKCTFFLYLVVLQMSI